MPVPIPLLLSEADVQSLLTMPLALETVERSFAHLASGAAQLHARQRLHVPGKAYLHYMAAADGPYMGLKAYSSSRGELRFIVLLFSADSGEFLAHIEANYLGQMRTGAATGVAARYMARADARHAAILGTGLQAAAQLEALSHVRKLERVRAFSRDRARREAFAAQMSQKLGVRVDAADSAEEAARGAEIIVTATNSAEPVLEARWLQPGMFLAAIGANFAHKRELEAGAVRRCDRVVADSREQARIEAGDLIQAFGAEDAQWRAVAELADVVAGRAPGRANVEEITLFKSTGLATEDIATAGVVYELALRCGVGRRAALR